MVQKSGWCYHKCPLRSRSEKFDEHYYARFETTLLQSQINRDFIDFFHSLITRDYVSVHVCLSERITWVITRVYA
jgi:hypothetical protein